MERRQFLKTGSIIVLGLITTSRLKAASLVIRANEIGQGLIERILEIIKELK